MERPWKQENDGFFCEMSLCFLLLKMARLFKRSDVLMHSMSPLFQPGRVATLLEDRNVSKDFTEISMYYFFRSILNAAADHVFLA